MTGQGSFTPTPSLESATCTGQYAGVALALNGERERFGYYTQHGIQRFVAKLSR